MKLKRETVKNVFLLLGKQLVWKKIVNLVTGNERPDKTFEENEGLTELMKSLEKLPENQRIALTLSKVEGYNNTEIAETMQTTVAAVESLIYRAKQHLINERRNQ